MGEYSLDDVDKQLLHLLQEDARHTAIELADELGVSDNTVHNRMGRLEEAGIITGYTATIDYREAGLSLYFLFICTARISDRATVAENALALANVVEATELMTGQRNLLIKALGEEDHDITNVARQLDNLNLEINDEVLIRDRHAKPLDFLAVDRVISEES